jgi:hypothetical protein
MNPIHRRICEQLDSGPTPFVGIEQSAQKKCSPPALIRDLEFVLGFGG